MIIVLKGYQLAGDLFTLDRVGSTYGPPRGMAPTAAAAAATVVAVVLQLVLACGTLQLVWQVYLNDAQSFRSNDAGHRWTCWVQRIEGSELL